MKRSPVRTRSGSLKCAWIIGQRHRLSSPKRRGRATIGHSDMTKLLGSVDGRRAPDESNGRPDVLQDHCPSRVSATPTNSGALDGVQILPGLDSQRTPRDLFRHVEERKHFRRSMFYWGKVWWTW